MTGRLLSRLHAKLEPSRDIQHIGEGEFSVRAESLSAGYGPLPVIQDVSVEVRPGEVIALLGANGAGKSTTLAAMSGELPLLGGSVWWLGRPAASPTFRRCREGLAFVTEERSVFPSLTTHENLRLGRGEVERAIELMPELKPLLRRKAGLLSGGEQQMLALARVLAAAPKVMFADELSLGLAPLVVARLLQAVRDAAHLGVAVLLVEQHLDLALSIADRAYVMQRGRIVLEGDAVNLRGRRAEIEASYLSAVSSDL